MKNSLYLPRPVPAALDGLVTLALDTRWSWHHGADQFWRKLDHDLWESLKNPWLLMITISFHRLEELAEDEAFVAMLRNFLEERESYFQEKTWYLEHYHGELHGMIAYFSMEFGLGESLPIYSGGLGILAGDFLKTASDLGLPILGVGLLYQQGYFRQALDEHGNQQEFYPYNDPTMLPVTPLRDRTGEWVDVQVQLPGRLLYLRAWRAQVGRRSLFLLDSNDPRNEPGDRGITSELYGGGREQRLEQEIILGIGGWRLLETLGLDVTVCHLNEGHAAFATLERARYHMRLAGCSFHEAWWLTRSANLFTTHTPVEAGFDHFEPNLMRRYFEDYTAELGISMNELLALGRVDPGNDSEHFNMAWLASRGAGAINGVSRLHGEVSRDIFSVLFPRWPEAEVPVGHVTNGVHMPTWDSPAADKVWTSFCGKNRWAGSLEAMDEHFNAVTDEELWRLRNESRLKLVQFLRRRLVRQRCALGANGDAERRCGLLLDPDGLTVGFARRFTAYKRPNLLLRHPERLIKLLSDRDRPLQLVFAGKSHPQDKVGKAMLREWHEFMERHELTGRIVFIADYDMSVAAELVQGVDVWINTPRAPWEACGTSGMKVLVNGGLNLSSWDGWWAEAYAPDVGWSLGDGTIPSDVDRQDAEEAEALIRILEEQVVPTFYERNDAGLPKRWVDMMRASMTRLAPAYSSNRMLREYTDQYYVPLNAAFRRRTTAGVAGLQAWAERISRSWDRLHFGQVSSREEDGAYVFEVQAYLDDLPAGAVSVQLYAAAKDGLDAVLCRMERGEALVGSTTGFHFHGVVPADRPIEHYTARIVPEHPDVQVPLEMHQILWQR